MIRFLRWVSLVATLGLTSTLEYSGGIAAGLTAPLPFVGWPIAVLLPISVDAYVMAALLSGRDVVPALVLLEAAVITGAAHSHTDDPGTLLLAIVVGTALTAVLWRVDALFHAEAAERARAAGQERQAREAEAKAAIAAEQARRERAQIEATQRAAEATGAVHVTATARSISKAPPTPKAITRSGPSRAPGKAALRDALPEDGTPIARQAWMAAAGITSNSTFKNAAADLVDRGEAVRLSPGVYRRAVGQPEAVAR